MPEIVQLYPNRKPRKRPSIAYKPQKGLSRKSSAPKGTKRRKTKNPLKKARLQLWELCKIIIRKKYGNTCYTCGATNLSGGNWHTAHFIARSICGLWLRYDLRNLRPGCYRCNISLAGNGAAFYRNLVEREGQAYVDGIFSDKGRETKETLSFYEEKIAAYQNIVDNFTTPVESVQ